MCCLFVCQEKSNYRIGKEKRRRLISYNRGCFWTNVFNSMYCFLCFCYRCFLWPKFGHTLVFQCPWLLCFVGPGQICPILPCEMRLLLLFFGHTAKQQRGKKRKENSKHNTAPWHVICTRALHVAAVLFSILGVQNNK